MNVAVITLESMTTPPNANSNESSSTGISGGFALLMISAILPLYLFTMAMWPPGGNDFGAHGMMMAAVGIAFLLVSPLTAASGLFLIHHNSRRITLRLLAWITAIPTIFVLSYLVFEMRPIPKYDPQDYQHFVGKNLRDVRSELDTRKSLSGSMTSANGVRRYLGLRGMEILANRDGIILEVKTGKRE